MVKIIRVDNCWLCPNFLNECGTGWCEKEDNRVIGTVQIKGGFNAPHIDVPIPSWCPLEDFEVEKEAVK